MRMLARITIVAAIALSSCRTPAPDARRITIELRHVSAVEVAEMLNDLVAAARDASAYGSKGSCVLYAPGHFPAAAPSVPFALADASANAVAVRVEAEDEIQLRELIARLDAPR